MSNIIPMVSSSPPPIDDSGGFGWDDDDDDDFGTFASADNSFQTPGKTDTSVGNSFMNSIPDNNTNDVDDFADFEAFSSETINEVTFPTVNNSINEDKLDKHPVIEDQIDEIDTITSAKDDKFVNSEITLSDSGVYSSNISPVQQCDNNSQCKDVIEELDCNNSVVPSTDSVLDIVDEPKSVDELDDSLMETCQAHLNIPFDDTNPQVVCDDDFKSTDVEQSDDIPQTEQNSSLSHVNIPATDSSSNVHNMEHDPDCKDEDTQSYKSSESDKDVKCDSIKSDSASGNGDSSPQSVNVDNEELHSCQNPSQSDLNNVSDVNSDNLVIDIDDDKCVPDVLQHENVGNSNVTKSSSNDRLNDSNELNTGQEITDATEEVNSNNISSDDDFISNNESDNGKLQDSVKVTNDDFNAFTDETQTASVEVVKVNDDNDVKLTVDTSEQTEISEGVERLANNVSDKDNVNKTSDTNEESDTEINVKTNSVDEAGFIVETSDEDDFGDFNTSCTFNTNTDVKDIVSNSGNNNDNENDDDDFGDFGDFSQNVTNTELGSDINVKTKNKGDDASDFSQNVTNNESVDNSNDNAMDEDDFGDFSANFSNTNTPADDKSFGDFNATFDTQDEKTDEQSNDWAAFSEPQIVSNTEIVDDDDDDEWSGFADDDDVKEEQQQQTVISSVTDHHGSIPPDHLANMSKQEKVVYAVTSCFPTIVDADSNTNDNDTNLSEFTLVSDSCNVWSHVKGQRTTDALTYHWTKSQWNTQLFSTLHIDTRNILIGHKKTVVPVFAAGLTLLEPTKGSTSSSSKPHVLVDTTKSDNAFTSQSQESIPVAEFDWTGSGLTNPLEANNKTLNLDFLIQDQATKSSALESEFMGTSDSSVYKPTIQPLENILANLKPSSTFKPTNQNEAYSEEASKVVQSLPDLSFMTSKVLMFPVRIDGL
ncbi:hypothetical protein ACF0H5_003475 [Mactra antiquata]